MNSAAQENTASALLSSIFSDGPAPEIHAAIIVSHCGDECLGALWLLSRLWDRASLFRLTTQPHTDGADAVTLSGIPRDRCHDLGLPTGGLAEDLEALTWLITSSVKTLAPRLLVTHSCAGVNVDHDASAFAVHMTARLLPVLAAASPLVLEFHCQHDGPDAVPSAEHEWPEGVRVDFGPDSRRLKEQILRAELGAHAAIHPALLKGEIYRPACTAEFVFAHDNHDRLYCDGSGRTVGEFRASARAAASGFERMGLLAHTGSDAFSSLREVREEHGFDPAAPPRRANA
jgi:hypothetical protein